MNTGTRVDQLYELLVTRKMLVALAVDVGRRPWRQILGVEKGRRKGRQKGLIRSVSLVEEVVSAK